MSHLALWLIVVIMIELRISGIVYDIRAYRRFDFFGFRIRVGKWLKGNK